MSRYRAMASGKVGYVPTTGPIIDIDLPGARDMHADILRWADERPFLAEAYRSWADDLGQAIGTAEAIHTMLGERP